MYSRLIGTGAYLPENIVTNDDLSKKVDTSHEWISSRTGIHQRHIVSGGENAVNMALHAAQQAIEIAGVSVEDIDLVIFSSCSPDQLIPSQAALLHAALGLKSGVPTFDMNSACAGFVYASVIADQFIRCQSASCVLVVGSEVMSRLTDWSDRSTCVLFGDGAGAVIYKADSVPGILAHHVGCDGQYSELLKSEKTTEGEFLRMSGREVFKMAVNTFHEISNAVLNSLSLSIEDINWMVPHQANVRIIQAAAKQLNMPMDRIVTTVDKHANTSAASIPLALHDGLFNQKCIKSGDYILFLAFGAGLSWGAFVLKY